MAVNEHQVGQVLAFLNDSLGVSDDKEKVWVLSMAQSAVVQKSGWNE